MKDQEADIAEREVNISTRPRTAKPTIGHSVSSALRFYETHRTYKSVICGPVRRSMERSARLLEVFQSSKAGCAPFLYLPDLLNLKVETQQGISRRVPQFCTVPSRLISTFEIEQDTSRRVLPKIYTDIQCRSHTDPSHLEQK